MSDTLSASTTATPDSFWRSLWFFSVYRIVVGAVFLIAALAYGDALSIGTQNYAMFMRAAWLYVAAAIAFLFALRRDWPTFNIQLTLQVFADVLFLTLMMYASGGQKSGIAVLLLVVVAGAGLVGQGRMTLFYAALATVAVLIEQSGRALLDDAAAADFVRTGLTCIGFFGTAITARLLARRVVANEELARRRGNELANQLKISERIIRDMTDGVLVVGRDGRVRQSNATADKLLSLRASGTMITELPLPLAAKLTELTIGKNDAMGMLRTAEGRPIRIRVVSSDQGGDALVYLEDMERVQAQAQQLKLAALGRLTANLAHEIRNPLAAISHAAELLGEDEVDPLRGRLAGIIGDNAERLNRLVTEVLELGRRDRAEPESLHWGTFSLALMEEYSLHEPGVISRVSVSGPDLSFRFDRAHMHRVLWNLLGNALRHASDRPGAVQLELRGQGAPGRVELHIIDDGSGIDSGLRSQIFEPFVTTRGNGTGLGLYIARELCEANGATLDLLDNTPGAHFRVIMEARA